MNVELVAPGERLRICVVGDLDGIHTHSWLTYFVARGHDVHGVSYYLPARPPEGVVLHALRPAASGGGRAASGARPGRTSALPRSLQRLAHYLRYRRAGLSDAVREIAPDVLHAHYVTEHGFYATSAAGRQPYVVSAWGSDVLVDGAGLGLNRALARYVLSKSSLATANNRHMADRMRALGANNVEHIVLGIPRDYVAAAQVDRAAVMADHPTIISSRALDTLYNVDTIIRAIPAVRERVQDARLVIAGDGLLRPKLEALASSLHLDDCITFAGQLSQDALRRAFAGANVFVSVPSSDATSVALLQAMAAGCFPVVSDLPSQQELVEDGVTGFRLPLRETQALAEALVRGLEDTSLRRQAAERNLAFVLDYGILEDNMARMETLYQKLVSG